MPNSIKYSTTGDTQSLRDGNFYIGTGDVGKGPTSSSGHWNGITPPGGGYTVYKNKVSNGPAIWTATSDNQLISLTNNIEGTSFTTAQQCLNYYATQTDKMVFNKNYEGIVTNGLVFNMDAGFIPSYPTNGTTWYDLSYGGYNGSLINGPTFSSLDGGYFSFDYTDDYVSTTGMENYSYTNGITVAIWNYNGGGVGNYRGVVTNGTVDDRVGGFDLRYGREDSGRNLYWAVRNSSNTASSITITGDLNQWGYYVGTYDNSNTYGYKNGVLIGSNPLTGGGQLKTMSNSTTIGWSPGTGEYLDGRLSTVQIYNRPLTSSEVLKNYNAGLARFNTSNIVKDNLVLDLNASNSVSYPTTGTEWRDLSGNGNKGTLTNGPTFDSTTKSIVFDGTDDYVIGDLNINFSTTDFTIDTLVYPTFDSATYGRPIITKNGVGDGCSTYDFALEFGRVSNKFDIISDGGAGNPSLYTTNTYQKNNWYRVIVTREFLGGTNYKYTLYVNGNVAGTITGNYNGGNGSKIGIGKFIDCSAVQTWLGNIGISRIYNRALSQSEILQNYYQAPISTNGLALAIDPGNLVCYSGTGTTLKGLSPSGYTATLTNGPTYSSANGGTIVLDGVDDTITSSLTRVGFSDTTQIIWYKWDGVNKIASIMYLGNGGSTGYGFLLHDGSSSGVGNKVGILYGGAYYNAINVGTTYATLVSGVWSQLAVTRDSTTTRLYQNGTLLGSTTRTPQGPSSTLSLEVSNVVGGSIGPSLFYNTALTADEVAQNFNAYKTRFGL